MYFIEDGTVSIRIQGEKGETEISKLEKGQYFGELALVTHRPRAASAYAENQVKVACKCNNFSPKTTSRLSDEFLMTVCFSPSLIKI